VAIFHLIGFWAAFAGMKKDQTNGGTNKDRCRSFYASRVIYFFPCFFRVVFDARFIA